MSIYIPPSSHRSNAAAAALGQRPFYSTREGLREGLVPENGGGDLIFPSGQLILPENYAMASRFIPLTIANAWEDAECSDKAAHRNAYPGLEWNYLLAGRGGAWPYYWELLEAPTGMTLQSNPAIDSVTKRLIFNSDYERLVWQNPVAGSHTITVRLVDQFGTNRTKTWTLVVGTANHAFIDTAIGNNSNDGTINSPLLDDFGLHGGLTANNAHQGKTVWIKGTFVLQGMSDASGNYRFDDSVPRVLRAMPGENAEIIQRSWFVNPGSNDLTISGITISHDDPSQWSSEQTNRKMISLLSGGSRIDLVDIKNENYSTGPTSSSNPAHVYSSRSVTDGLVMKNWDVSGSAGTLFNTYMTKNSIFERLNVHDVEMINADGSSSAHVFRLKGGDHYNTVIRGCELWKNITWLAGNGGIGVVSYPEDGVDICYNKVSHHTRGLFQYGGSSGSNVIYARNIHVYRNSFDTVVWWGNNTLVEDEYWDNNIFTDGTEPIADDPNSLFTTDNVFNQQVLDSNWNILPEFNQLHGTHGADLYSEQL